VAKVIMKEIEIIQIVITPMTRVILQMTAKKVK